MTIMTMRHFTFALLGAVMVMVIHISGAANTAADAVRFFSVLDDLPLMAGLSEDDSASLKFDGPSGRIIESYASGNVTPLAVAAFYAEVLPQLGWQRRDDGTYDRDDEILTLDIAAAPDAAAGLRVTLRPRQ